MAVTNTQYDIEKVSQGQWSEQGKPKVGGENKWARTTRLRRPCKREEKRTGRYMKKQRARSFGAWATILTIKSIAFSKVVIKKTTTNTKTKLQSLSVCVCVWVSGSPLPRNKTHAPVTDPLPRNRTPRNQNHAPRRIRLSSNKCTQRFATIPCSDAVTPNNSAELPPPKCGRQFGPS